MLTASAPPPISRDHAVNLFHDARAVHDTAALRFREFAADGGSAWVVSVVIPASDSGSAILPGSDMDKETGEVTQPPGAQASLKKAGVWKAAAAAQPSDLHGEGSYSWLEAREFHKHVTVPEDYYSPFVGGGTIIFRHNAAASGLSEFESASLIFPQWTEDAAKASAFLNGHPGLLENGEQRAPEIAQLRLLLGDKNKFLAMEAFRELAQSGHLDVKLALEQVTEAEAPLDSILVYLMLTSRGNNGFAEQLKAVTDSSREQEKLRSIALGAFSAMLFRAEDLGILARCKVALENVHSRLRDLKIWLDPNSELYSILTKAGVS